MKTIFQKPILEKSQKQAITKREPLRFDVSLSMFLIASGPRGKNQHLKQRATITPKGVVTKRQDLSRDHPMSWGPPQLSIQCLEIDISSRIIFALAGYSLNIVFRTSERSTRFRSTISRFLSNRMNCNLIYSTIC